VEAQPSVFGTPMRDKILIALALKGQSHASELARAFGVTVPGVWKAVRQLEKDGLVAAVAHGRTRVLQLNSRWYAKPQLRELLERMAEARSDVYDALSAVRGRPRRSGKAR
jgi:predicted transcriptional regulator